MLDRNAEFQQILIKLRALDFEYISKAVMNAAHNQADRARFIAVSSSHAGDFLNAIPSSQLSALA